MFRVAVDNAASMDEKSRRPNYESLKEWFKKLLGDYISWLADALVDNSKGVGASIPEVRNKVYGLMKKYFNDDYKKYDKEYSMDSGKRKNSSRRNNRKDRKLKKKDLR